MQKGLDSGVVVEGQMLTDIEELKSKLKVLIKDPKQHSEALNLLFQLAERLKNSSIAEAYSFAREALRMSQQQDNEHLKADAHLAMANCSWKMAQYSLALEHFEEALNIYLQVKDHKGIAHCYNGMGIVAAETGESVIAVEYFEHAMRYIKRSPKPKLATVFTGNIGHVYLNLQRFEEAMHCFEHALEEYTALGNEDGMANMLGGMAGVHVQTGAYDKGLELLKKVKELRRSHGPHRGMAVALMNTGITLLRMRQFQQAKQELEEARNLMESVHFAMYLPDVLKHLMHASIELKNTAQFNKYLHLYEEDRHADIIQQARERHQQFRQFQTAETQSLGQILS